MSLNFFPPDELYLKIFEDKDFFNLLTHLDNKLSPSEMTLFWKYGAWKNALILKKPALHRNSMDVASLPEKDAFFVPPSPVHRGLLTGLL